MNILQSSQEINAPKVIILPNYISSIDSYTMMFHPNLPTEVFQRILEEFKQPTEWFAKEFCRISKYEIRDIVEAEKDSNGEEIVKFIDYEFSEDGKFFFTLGDLIIDGDESILIFLQEEYGFMELKSENFFIESYFNINELE